MKKRKDNCVVPRSPDRGTDTTVGVGEVGNGGDTEREETFGQGRWLGQETQPQL